MSQVVAVPLNEVGDRGKQAVLAGSGCQRELKMAEVHGNRTHPGRY